MKCRVMILDTTGPTYTFYEIKKNKRKQRKTKTKKTNRKRNKRGGGRNCRAPPQGMWLTLTLGRNELNKKKKKKHHYSIYTAKLLPSPRSTLHFTLRYWEHQSVE